jgi:hypothetical protein
MDMNEANFMLVWIAVQSLAPEQALATLKLEWSDGAETRNAPGWPDFVKHPEYEDRIFIGQLPGEWLLLFGNIDEKDKARLARLTQFGPAVAGELSRIGSFAEGRYFADGQEVWSVDYDFERWGRDDRLELEGELPTNLAAIIGEAYAAVAQGIGRDNKVDILFEVPGRLSKAICGFSPHEDPPEGFRWSMLQPVGGMPKPAPAPRGWLSRLFGRR